MPTSIMDRVAAAKASVPSITPAEADAMRDRDDVMILDVRDPSEVAATGKIAGAINVSRGMLEFKADPSSPYYDPAFDPKKTVAVYCASGGRSALAGQVLQDLGFKSVHNLGAFKEWTAAGLPTE